MTSRSRNTQKGSPTNVLSEPAMAQVTATADPVPSTPTDVNEYPHWFKVFLLGVSILVFLSGTLHTTLGVRRAIKVNEDRYAQLASRATVAYGYSVFQSSIIYLTLLSVGWLTIYVVADTFAKSAKQPPVSISFPVAMNKFLPFAMGGMWIGHAIRLGIDLQDITYTWLRVWAITVLATNGPALLLYVRVRTKAATLEAQRKARAAASSEATAETAK